jgi:glutaminyl-tRNA synthetase
MNSNTPAPTSNFIRTIIKSDFSSGKHDNIVTRFPPEPNGYLHIGHAKSICLNFGLAQDYNGKCNLRFDDTNPEKESQEYAQSIQDDVRWLGFQWDGEVRWSSDYFDTLYDFAVELINKGLAYVDDLTPEQMREYRGTLTQTGKNSPNRDRSVAENLDLFARMKGGEFADGAMLLRAKIDMTAANMKMLGLLAGGGTKSSAGDVGAAEAVGLGEFSGLVAETVPAAKLASYWDRFSGSVKQSLAAVNSSSNWAHC